jgi:hypothetical protein
MVHGRRGFFKKLLVLYRHVTNNKNNAVGNLKVCHCTLASNSKCALQLEAVLLPLIVFLVLPSIIL